jgi:tetratricopeptide (TPR) repeat protein
VKKLVLVLLLLAGAAAAADPVVDAASPAEKALLPLLAAGQYIKARDAAEKILAATPGSFLATWAMALVQHNEEGNHARALFHVRRAGELLAGRDPVWGKRVLEEEYWILFEMNRNADSLAVLDKIDALYPPADPGRRIWPLFKLGRADEARRIARELAASDDWNERSDGYNGMLSIEFEAHDREATYRWAVDGVRATQEKSCTILRNAAGSAFVRFRLGEAEAFALRAGKAEQDCANGGYDQLAGLYILTGELQKAVSALETLRGLPIEKRYRPHFALTRRIILVDLLYALGKVEDAERVAGDLYGLPPRTGMTSSSTEMERIIRGVRYFMALDTGRVLERERRSYGTLVDLAPPPSAVARVLRQIEIRRALIQLLADEEVLVTLTRPNLGEIYEWSPWKAGVLIEVLGTGVMKRAIAEARARDADYPEAGPYLVALEGEIAFRRGELAEADRLASRALAELPKEEALLRYRTMAWQAEALRRLGRAGEARPLYHELLAQLPSALRFLDLKVPARITAAADALSAEAASRLRGSSRFDLSSADAPFRLDVGVKGGAVEICLLDDAGAQLVCAAGEKRDRAPDAVRSGLDAFHAAAFSPKVALKQSDLSSLDGTPVRVGADEVLKGVLEP